MIDARLVVAQPIDGGYTWTLTSRLGEMLREAERLFGPRDKTYTLLGVEFSGTHPQLWYPGNCGNIVIQLSLHCLHEFERAYYQLAHETVHLLSPTGSANTTNLEEGLAEWFATRFMTEHFAGGERWNSDLDSYKVVRDRVTHLMTLDPGTVQRARLIEPSISHISADVLREVCPTLGPQADFLCERFVR